MSFKRNLLTLSLFAAAIAFTGAQASAAPAGHAYGHQHGSKQVAAKSVVYTCPMDPEVVSDKPGRCPKCKMFLEKTEVKPGKKPAAKK